MTAALLDHLWQSTLVAALAALLALALHNNSARVRFWLWFAASIKFLVPFAALAALGESLARLLPVTAPSAHCRCSRRCISTGANSNAPVSAAVPMCRWALSR